MKSIKLTQYSHGQGCGCKISPKILDTILTSSIKDIDDKHLLVGHHSRDDAAVYDLGDGEGIISTTDFFMPIVDDPTTFGRVAATNAISDVYAMGGIPLMAIAIFAWPIDKLAPEVGQKVIEGGKKTCADAGIVLAGGHSIDAPEPIFGLAVTGKVKIKYLKKNSTAKVGDKIYLTKPLGIGILSTAQKQNKITLEDEKRAIKTMCQLNDIGSKIAKISGINAMTDVTGFGLGGHLLEVCLASKCSAVVDYKKIPILPNVENYLQKGCSPGGAQRNLESYKEQLSPMNAAQQAIICDPQTSGGLLVMVADYAENEFHQVAKKAGFELEPIGEIVKNNSDKPTVQINI